MLCVHLWDVIWFVVAIGGLGVTGKKLRDAYRNFIFIDILSLTGLSCLVPFLAPTSSDNGTPAVLGLAWMLLMAITDFYFNRQFFVPHAARQNADAGDSTPSARSNASAKRRIYFAGPLFTHAEWEWNRLLAQSLADEYDVFLPQSRSEPMLTGQEPFEPQTLFDVNTDEIARAVAVVAIWDQADADSGTSWECGYAYKAGIPVVGIRTDLRNTGDDGSVNLMLRRSCAEFIPIGPANRTDINALATAVKEAIRRSAAT
jgi:nucleoside 2-deoxyribosyltransferase